MNKLINYPVHKDAVLQDDFKIKVRALGETDWQEISTYRVKVDMHDVRNASMARFDFEGEVEVEISGPWYIYQVDIRPLSKNIDHTFDNKVVRFNLTQPENLSIEFNEDRYHNLHLFASKIDHDLPDKHGENTVAVGGSLVGSTTFGEGLIDQLNQLPKGRTLYIEPGIHYIEESIFRIPSDTNIYIAGGATIIGAFICSEVENIRIYGRGIIYQADLPRFSAHRGIRISHSKNIRVEDLIIINPPHYTAYIGGSKEVHILNIKAFSCEGWSDGIDIMSCENVLVEGCFMRNSDDCVAVYGRRWSNEGDTRNIIVKNMTLWADVAHPTNVGSHGDYENEGNVIEDIQFMDIDILEHNERQMDYLGCMAINVGDKNTVRNVSYENIRIEAFKRGKLLDFQVKFNEKYNPAPGKRIENIVLKNIQYHGRSEVTSMIKGYNKEFIVDGIHLRDIYVNDQKMTSLEEANIHVGDFAYNVTID